MKVSPSGSGQHTVDASYSGDATYAASISATLSLTATLVQTITFPNPGTQIYGVPQITLSAKASSGLPVSYSVISGPAKVSGDKLTIMGAGSVKIKATQAGNGTYSAAIPVSVTFTVNKAMLKVSDYSNGQLIPGVGTAIGKFS
jgi:hypothetical protein